MMYIAEGGIRVFVTFLNSWTTEVWFVTIVWRYNTMGWVFRADGLLIHNLDQDHDRQCTIQQNKELLIQTCWLIIKPWLDCEQWI